ncbi:Uncharacterised protein [Mycobacterium tuberculosis]|nr:Uncharacterised protein [Mycobacterium tuberculosis]CKR93131.1 Uncharacterised protein [Mycobacterium tuberculosis]CKS04957.1 Uncharacterised protein [Mycobacterium tuberculosis]
MESTSAGHSAWSSCTTATTLKLDAGLPHSALVACGRSGVPASLTQSPTLSSATLVADEHPVATTNKAVVAAASQARIDAAGQRRRPSRSMSER